MSTEELIKYCKQGQPTYQRMLVNQFSSDLFTTCMRYCKNREDAKDCLQDAWLNIFKSLSDYKGEGAFAGWMHRVAVNCCLKKYRKTASVIRIEANRKITKSDHQPVVFGQLNVEEIFKLLDQLSDVKRLVFTLYVVEGYTHAEIAESLGFAESSSRSILTRARKEIKNLIVSYDKALEL